MSSTESNVIFNNKKVILTNEDISTSDAIAVDGAGSPPYSAAVTTEDDKVLSPLMRAAISEVKNTDTTRSPATPAEASEPMAVDRTLSLTMRADDSEATVFDARFLSVTSVEERLTYTAASCRVSAAMDVLCAATTSVNAAMLPTMVLMAAA